MENEDKVRAALANQGAPYQWYDLLTDKQRDRLAATINDDGTPTAETRNAVREVKEQIYESQKASVDES